MTHFFAVFKYLSFFYTVTAPPPLVRLVGYFLIVTISILEEVFVGTTVLHPKIRPVFS